MQGGLLILICGGWRSPLRSSEIQQRSSFGALCPSICLLDFPQFHQEIDEFSISRLSFFSERNRTGFCGDIDGPPDCLEMADCPEIRFARALFLSKGALGTCATEPCRPSQLSGAHLIRLADGAFRLRFCQV